MLDDNTKNQVKKLHSQWQQQATKSKALNKKNITVSGEEINFPGAYPYTRGVHANMYRGKMVKSYKRVQQ